jgi:cation diffusion facilitator family transporter
MPCQGIASWSHEHRFEGGDEAQGERRTTLVVGLTLATMVVEIVAGMTFNSMALLADGWHMSTHAGALGLAVVAYALARRYADHPHFVFGTAKIGTLAAFANGIVLALVALLIAWESAQRFVARPTIAFNEAIVVAVLGLAVNLVSARILGSGGGHHGHAHDHNDGAGAHRHHDHNLRAAYLHVAADALTSVLAIVALLFGKFLGWSWLDPAVGILGAAAILYWSVGLLRESGRTLLDWNDDTGLERQVRAIVEGDADSKIADLHIWKVGRGHYAAIVSVVTHRPREASYYQGLLRPMHGLGHVTIEVHQCRAEACLVGLAP